jgi:predicted Holliday junction resolvase-like endonuclease
MTLLKAKLILKKSWLWAKKFWWAIIIFLLFLLAVTVGILTRNGSYIAGLLDLMEAKSNAHDQEMETLSHIHNTEVAEKNLRLQEHLRRRTELEEEFKSRGESLDKEKEAELKRLVDEGYNDPEKLADEIRKAFGIKND